MGQSSTQQYFHQNPKSSNRTHTAPQNDFIKPLAKDAITMSNNTMTQQNKIQLQVVSRSQANAKPNSASGNRIHTNKSKESFHKTLRRLFQTVLKHFRERHRQTPQLLCRSFQSLPKNRLNSSVSKDCSTRFVEPGARKMDSNNHFTHISTLSTMVKLMEVLKLRCISLAPWILQMVEARSTVVLIQFRSQMDKQHLQVPRKCSSVSDLLKLEVLETRSSLLEESIIPDLQPPGMKLNTPFTRAHSSQSRQRSRFRTLRQLRFLAQGLTLANSTHQGQ